MNSLSLLPFLFHYREKQITMHLYAIPSAENAKQFDQKRTGNVENISRLHRLQFAII